LVFVQLHNFLTWCFLDILWYFQLARGLYRCSAWLLGDKRIQTGIEVSFELLDATFNSLLRNVYMKIFILRSIGLEKFSDTHPPCPLLDGGWILHKTGVQLTFAGCILSSLHMLLGRSDNDCMTSDVALEMPAKLSLRMAQEFTTFVSKRDLRAQSVGFSRFSWCQLWFSCFFLMFVRWFVGSATSSTISCETCCSIFGVLPLRGLASSLPI
jgi:hypothetical protein